MTTQTLESLIPVITKQYFQDDMIGKLPERLKCAKRESDPSKIVEPTENTVFEEDSEISDDCEDIFKEENELS